MAALKFPKLLRSEYLIHSPIWNSYKSGDSLPSAIFSINQKLFSAQVISELTKHPSNNDLEPSYINFTKQLAQREALAQQMRGKFHFDSAVHQKMKAYLDNRKNKDNKQFMEVISKTYAKIDDQPNELGPSTLIEQKGHSMTWFLRHLVALSKRKKLDELDLLILLTIPLDLEHVELLNGLMESNANKAVTIQYLHKVGLKLIAQGQAANISSLRKFLTQLSNNGSSSSCSSVLQKVFSVLCSIMNPKDLKYDLSNAHLLEMGRQSMYVNGTELSYSQVIVHQFLLYMDWLAVKCIFAPNIDSLATSLEQFCQKFVRIDSQPAISQLTQLNPAPHEIQHLRKLHMRIGLAKLEIISFLYNAITATTVAVQKVNKSNKSLAKNRVLQKLLVLRNLKLEKEKTAEKTLTVTIKTADKMQGSESLDYMFRLIESIEYVQKLTNASPRHGASFQVNNRLCSTKMKEIAEKILAKASQYQIIVFNPIQLKSIKSIFSEVSFANGTPSNPKLTQFYSKIHKQFKGESKDLDQRGQKAIEVFQSAAQLKRIWKYLVGHNFQKNEQYGHLRNATFLLRHTPNNETSRVSASSVVDLSVQVRRFFE